MSADIRLDPETLRHVASRLRAELLPALAHSSSSARATLRSSLGLPLSDEERDTLAALADVAGVVEDAIVGIEAEASKAETAPSLLAVLQRLLDDWSEDANDHDHGGPERSAEPPDEAAQQWWDEGYRCGILSAWADLGDEVAPLLASKAKGCPGCAECFGEPHHWMHNSAYGAPYDDGKHPDHAWCCKHCDHTQNECPACGHDGCVGDCPDDEEASDRDAVTSDDVAFDWSDGKSGHDFVTNSHGVTFCSRCRYTPRFAAHECPGPELDRLAAESAHTRSL